MFVMNLENPTTAKKANNRNRNRNRTRKTQPVTLFNQSSLTKYRNKPEKGQFVFNIPPKTLEKLMGKNIF